MLEYKKMTQEELDECSLLAAEAFYDYEYFTIYFTQEKRRQRFINALLNCDFKTKFKKTDSCYFTAWKNNKIVAVALLCKPGFKRPSVMDYIKSGYLNVAFKGGIAKTSVWVKMDSQASSPCHQLGGKNWYLGLLAVARSEEGNGIGSRFLHEYLIPYAKAAGGDTFSLFTNAEINCKFYEKNGFSVFDIRKFEYKGRSVGSWSYSMKL